MALYYLSGMELVELGKPKKNKATTAPKKRNPVATIALAPSRGAFLAAIALNFVNLAQKMDRALKKDQGRVLSWWLKFGGKADVLKEAMQKGLKKDAKHDAKKAAKGVNGMDFDDAEIGEPITLTAALAAATPIIIAAVALLKDMKVTDAAEQAQEQDTTGKLKNVLANDPSVAKDSAEMPDGAEVAKVVNDGAESSDGVPFYKKPAVLIGGGLLLAGGAYMLTRKN